MSVSHKRILIGITGGIAAYKIPELVRQLKKAQAIVRIVMTPNACHFISPLTLQALSGQPVHLELMDHCAEAAMGHIELARWAECILVAPASANFISKMASGQADNLLLTLCLATTAPIYLAPAMNQVMWLNTLTQTNIAKLKQHNVSVWGPDSGEQACGDTGLGRLLEPNQLFDHLTQSFLPKGLTNQNILITAGPTQEAIDPVRYITNYSSGKMGFALAEAAAALGAHVTLITGPVNITLQKNDNIERIDVITAQQMHDAVLKQCLHTPYHLFIGSAAVSDYRPTYTHQQKLKKQIDGVDDLESLALTKNPDIIQAVSDLIHNRPYTVGFAAETQEVILYAQQKMIQKKLDMIIANSVVTQHCGFNTDTNAVDVLFKDKVQKFPVMSKKILAQKLIQFIAQQMSES